MTAKWKSAKRSTQLAWQISTHYTLLQCSPFDGQEGPGQNAYVPDLFLEGRLMSGEVQILCPAGGGPAWVCRDAGLLLGLSRPPFNWEHTDWCTLLKRGGPASLTRFPFLLPAFCLLLSGVK